MDNKIVLNKSTVKKLIQGASLFTTGGGIPFDTQIKYLKSINTLKIFLVSLDQLPTDSYVCTAGELGPSNAPPLQKKEIIKNMHVLLEKISGVRIKGIYPPEIGQESVILETSHYLKLPLLDIDLVGTRAVPFLDINIFNLKNLDFSYTPLVACNEEKEIFIINSKVSHERLEHILRELTVLSKTGIIYFLGGVISTRKLKTLNISSPSYGKLLQLAPINTYDELIKSLAPKLIIEGVVTKKKDLKEKGFFCQLVYLQDKKSRGYKLFVLNEVIFIFNQDNKIISAVPERILLIDPKTLTGVPSNDLVPNKKVSIIVINPTKEWQTKRAYKIFGRDRFMPLVKNLS